jgi:inhibitor of cysteine peptidase
MKRIIITGVLTTFLIGANQFLEVYAQTPACAPSSLVAVRMGMQSEAVRNFQSCLINLGFSIPAGATGYFGTQTQAAVRTFYRDHFSLEHAATYIGPQGLARMRGLVGGAGQIELPAPGGMPPGQTAARCTSATLSHVRIGQENADVKNFQSCLIQSGFSIPAGATGYFGTQTRDAIRTFYRDVFDIAHEGTYIGPQGLGLIRQYAASGGFGGGEGLQKIASEEELRLYLSRASATIKGLDGDLDVMTREGGPAALSPLAAPAPQALDASGAASRISDTNVQVAGIDEPDIVKTDGVNIYFSRESYYYGRPIPFMIEQGMERSLIAPAPYYNPITSVIKAFPPSQLSSLTTIPAQGELLLLRDKKILTIFAGRDIQGFDVSNAANPQKRWTLTLDDNTSVQTSRLANGKVYVVTRSYLDYRDPCPRPWISQRGSLSSSVIFPCIELYRPSRIIPVDSTFTAFILNPETGAVENKISFVGSSQDSVTYMSSNALYVTYFYPQSFGKVLVRAIPERGSDLFPQDVMARVLTVTGYELSEESLLTELELILERYFASLSRDERLRVENEWQNRLTAYFKVHRREIETTSIVKIPLSTFAIANTGSVPGYPLNQYALDEYNGNLRIAVTVGQRWWGWGWAGFWPGNQDSANDVYVLDGNLQTIGAVRDLGLTERIFAARFIGPRAYLVTFRQIDPFYVLDLSDPRNPQLKGELKIPGFSSYLEPISDSIILGVGQEGSNVKLSLFDVSNPATPIEKDKYTLADSWTEVNSNHRAFLKDDKYKVFFLPGSQGGYIFSYERDKLVLKKAVSGYAVKRGLFLDDYFYVIGEDKIVVFDERTWEEINKLDLQNK